MPIQPRAPTFFEKSRLAPDHERAFSAELMPFGIASFRNARTSARRATASGGRSNGVKWMTLMPPVWRVAKAGANLRPGKPELTDVDRAGAESALAIGKVVVP